MRAFAVDLKAVQAGLDFHMSARGWCYHMELEGEPQLPKGEFDWAQSRINEARKLGLLEPGFILEDEGHEIEEQFTADESAESFVDRKYDEYIDARQTFEDSWQDFKWVDFWKDKEYFIQLLVEKVDLKSLFRNICVQNKISMANMKGAGSIEQKGSMALKFEEMEEKGKTPVLLACGDFDPPGLEITELLRDQFRDYSVFSGWNPENLIVERIGLNYDFIEKNGLSWIDGLMTASGKDMANPKHFCYIRNMYHVREYIEKYGARKCEANSVVVVPELGRRMLIDAIARFLGEDAYEKHQEVIEERKEEIRELITAKMEDEE